MQRIYFFVKTFTEPDHAEQFLDGTLYMRPLEYFVNLEERNNSYAGRADPLEGMQAHLQPSNIQVMINGIEIPSADLVAPVVIRQNLTQNIFCLHASHVDETQKFSTLNEFESHLRIPEENIFLGQYSVIITDVEEFFNRIKTAVITQNISMRRGLVKYQDYDPSTFHGYFSKENALFEKHNRFSHQREYRIAIDRNSQEASLFILNIGKLRDIAHLISLPVLNKTIKVSAHPKLNP